MASTSSKREEEAFIKVCVRVRPLAKSEALLESSVSINRHSLRRESLVPQVPRKTVAVIDDKVLIFDPSDSNKEFVPGVPTHENKRIRDLQYGFDRIFDENSTQLQVYLSAVSGLLKNVMDGINSTVFAYGATGAGKTFSMRFFGIVSTLCMKELFEIISKTRETHLLDLSVSYLEVYNETIRDLLCPSSNILDVREDANGSVMIAGLSEHHPENFEEISKLLQIGLSNRTQSSTKANDASSRSHAIFQINIQQRDKNSGTSMQVKTATLTFCDLAGSERASVTDNRGKLLREGANINRSLLSLGNCINSLCENKTQHVPYRDSKLTRILKHSLSGNCRTVMIANVSPALSHYEETLNTLKYAARTKNIKVSISRNTIDVQYHIGQYAELIEKLQDEVVELRLKLKSSTHLHQDSKDESIVTLKDFSKDFINRFEEEYQGFEEDFRDICTSTIDEVNKTNSCYLTKEDIKDLTLNLVSSASDHLVSLEDRRIVAKNQLVQFLKFIHEKQIIAPKMLENDKVLNKISKSINDEERSLPVSKSTMKSKKSRRASMLPKFDDLPRRDSLVSTRSTRRQSLLPLPTSNRRQSLIPRAPNSAMKQKLRSFQNENNAPVNFNTPKSQKLLEDIDEIDLFLEETPKAKKTQISKISPTNSVTPKPKQPLLRTSSELRGYINDHVQGSPQIRAIPFSPAQKKMV